MEDDIKQLIELDVMAEKLKEDYQKQIESKIKSNNQKIENLKLQKLKEIEKALEELKISYTKQIDIEIEKKGQERQKDLKQTEQILNQNKENITNFIMFNIKESFSSVK